MTNIEKWLIDNGFCLKSSETEYFRSSKKTKITYVCNGPKWNKYEAVIYILKDSSGLSDIDVKECIISATNALWFKINGSPNSKSASEAYQIVNERTAESAEQLRIWAKGMDNVKDPFKEELE